MKVNNLMRHSIKYYGDDKKNNKKYKIKKLSSVSKSCHHSSYSPQLQKLYMDINL